MWPSTKQCPQCWEANAFLKMAQFGLLVNEIEFDEMLHESSNLDEIYKYIMKVYGAKQGGFGSEESVIRLTSESKTQNVSLNSGKDDDIDMFPVFIMCFGTMFLWVVGRWYYLRSTGSKKKNDSERPNSIPSHKVNGMKNDGYWA